MKTRILVVLFVACCAFTVSSSLVWAGDKVLTMSTTTSTQSSGLLKVLLPEFEKDEGIKVKVIAKGTGAALRDGMDGNVDIIFVHAKAREQKFVGEGFGTKRYAVMHNDFVILGPASDPAGIKGMDDVAAALKKIAAVKAQFISRGDDSGTHTKEQNLWKSTGLVLVEKTQTIVKKGKKKDITSMHPSDSHDWYYSIGQGMGKTLTFADEKKAYVLTDRGTFIKYAYDNTPPIDLELFCEGDERLANPYGIIPINPEKHSHVRHDLAMKFTNWIVSARGQKLINDYRLVGKQLFYPDAVNMASK